MTTVLIVSRTKMKNGICVGGIDVNTNKSVRVLDANGHSLKDAPYQIGDLWRMHVEEKSPLKLPHSEDRKTTPRDVKAISNVGNAGILKYVEEHKHLLGHRFTQGSLKDTFEGCLHLTGTQNFVNEERIPSFSTQFWIADEDLVLSNVVRDEGVVDSYYWYKNFRVKFVGCVKPIDRIPKGTVIRLSLARWWDGDGKSEERCYLQISGWYM